MGLQKRGAHWYGESHADIRTELERCACPCGGETFELTLGAALHADSADVRWLYVGARCPSCGLTATYGDWKCEYPDVHALLALT